MDVAWRWTFDSTFFLQYAFVKLCTYQDYVTARYYPNANPNLKNDNKYGIRNLNFYMESFPLFDIPWRNKKSKLIWRGRALCDEEKSMNSIHSVDFFSCDQRMSLVRNHLKSKDLVDAKFHMPKKAQPKDMPQDYFGDKLDMEGMLQYKYQLAVEGTDISSGLKWMLFSNSIVFMPTPTYSSYAMETLLQPFVHYIPVKADMSNVEEMVQWCENHPDQAMHIAERSTLFMYDLFFHPDAYQDEQDVLTGIVERYQQLFQTYNE